MDDLRYRRMREIQGVVGFRGRTKMEYRRVSEKSLKGDDYEGWGANNRIDTFTNTCKHSQTHTCMYARTQKHINNVKDNKGGKGL